MGGRGGLGVHACLLLWSPGNKGYGQGPSWPGPIKCNQEHFLQFQSQTFARVAHDRRGRVLGLIENALLHFLHFTPSHVIPKHSRGRCHPQSTAI